MHWEVILAYNRVSLVSTQLEEGIAVNYVWCRCVWCRCFMCERLRIDFIISVVIQVKAAAPTGTCDGADDAR